MERSSDVNRKDSLYSLKVHLAPTRITGLTAGSIDRFPPFRTPPASRCPGKRPSPLLQLRFPPQVAQDGEHAAVVALIRGQAQLAEDAGHVLFHRSPGHYERGSD